MLCGPRLWLQMVQTFSRCVLSCEEEVDLDELLATRLLSFLMDHHQEILQVPMYLRNAVEQHIAFLTSQVKDLIEKNCNESKILLYSEILMYRNLVLV